MRKGGNEKCIAFLSDYGVFKNTPIQQKYNSPAAALYKVSRKKDTWKIVKISEESKTNNQTEIK